MLLSVSWEKVFILIKSLLPDFVLCLSSPICFLLAPTGTFWQHHTDLSVYILFSLSKPRIYLAVLCCELVLVVGRVDKRKAIKRLEGNILPLKGRGICIIFKEAGIMLLIERKPRFLF